MRPLRKSGCGAKGSRGALDSGRIVSSPRPTSGSFAGSVGVTRPWSMETSMVSRLMLSSYHALAPGASAKKERPPSSSSSAYVGMSHAPVNHRVSTANAGAEKLGVKLPAWVARHGSKRSAAAVINTFTRFRIILTIAVKYVTNVESYDQRIQSAINIQGKKMQRRAEFLLTRALRQAGWR